MLLLTGLPAQIKQQGGECQCDQQDWHDSEIFRNHAEPVDSQTHCCWTDRLIDKSMSCVCAHVHMGQQVWQRPSGYQSLCM